MKWLLVTAVAIAPATAFSWSGTDQNGNSVEIGRGELITPYRDIEIEVDGETRNFSVDSIRRYGNRVEIEGTDDSGNSMTLDMDGD
ncbi:hypothetical protein ACQKLX_07335 [Bosea sp. NPDC003192]|uniref:hypothetical protein n=1 Tax=Bosea sp. NPDC003192 TaxID=3390551 RepID=UPI003CFEBBB4